MYTTYLEEWRKLSGFRTITRRTTSDSYTHQCVRCGRVRGVDTRRKPQPFCKDCAEPVPCDRCGEPVHPLGKALHNRRRHKAEV